MYGCGLCILLTNIIGLEINWLSETSLPALHSTVLCVHTLRTRNPTVEVEYCVRRTRGTWRIARLALSRVGRVRGALTSRVSRERQLLGLCVQMYDP
jgi:hypothetical protein